MIFQDLVLTFNMNISRMKYQKFFVSTFPPCCKNICFKILCPGLPAETHVPEFTEDVYNKTVVAGREAVLTCHVDHIGSYKVAWVRVDTQTIMTIHNNIITRNQRVSLSHREHKEWKLHISNVQEVDRGWYMCQVNTDPMRSRRGYLEVQVPPSIVDQRSSNDLVVKEKARVNLTCEARGYPEPQILWRREDGKPIMARGKERGEY